MTTLPWIIAHRGASHDAPENTLAAVMLGWAQGADAVEVDCRLTGDGAIVAIHDADTSRVSGTDLIVGDEPLVELQQAIYRLLEQQYKKIMVAEVTEQYALRVIDPAGPPDLDDPAAPSRLLLVLNTTSVVTRAASPSRSICSGPVLTSL